MKLRVHMKWVEYYSFEIEEIMPMRISEALSKSQWTVNARLMKSPW